ncbi:hypothetical protein DH2020_010419 [Rehmannia glutinosa]|uniref:Uncharacterized protein n=1 Tax=Rehmannia glutinosa TaxID=99300 RepID=A0ABR0XAM8_REHGL
MAGSVEGEGFWLPAEFLTDDDFLMDKENFEKSNKTGSESEFFFPTVFPYDFETDGDKTHELWVMSTSPQSTLAHFGSCTGRSAGGSSNGSPNGVPSPPTTPLGAEYDAVGDLIYRAAGQVARLKLNRGDGLGPGPTMDKGLLGPPKTLAQFYPENKTPNLSVFPHTHKQQNKGCGVWYSQQKMYQNRGGRTRGETGQAAWTLQQNPTRERAMLLGGSGGGGAAAKRACAGTGVFLPRRYGNHNDSNNYSSNSHKKPDFGAKNFCRHYCFLRRLKEKKPHKPVFDSSTLSCPVHTGGSTALFHAHSNNFDNLNGVARSQPQFVDGSKTRCSAATTATFTNVTSRSIIDDEP